MSAELSHLYRSLTAIADGQELAHPEVIRRHADRRGRVRATGTALAVALLLGGVATGGRLVFSADEPAPVPPPADTPGPVPTSPALSPSASPSAPASVPSTRTAEPSAAPSTAQPTRRPPTSIPDRAFFVLAPANQLGLETARATPLLPTLCAARFPSEAAVVQRRARNLAYKLASTPPGSVPDGSYLHSITIYRPGRADDVLRELRQAVRSCPRQGPDETGVTWRQRLLDPGEYGDESVLFEMRAPYPEGMGEPGDEQVRLVRAVRIDDVVTVLWEQGWENTSAERAQVDADSRRAVRAIEDWLD
ncbi:hypothetical protein ACIBTV_03730 [Micromonospora sp. NPDC049366]|uniref:hypothetical protein n=1 Tax=Micromonospora sp. NPDC049366 TaxID=3364271 RepID=UPI00379C11CA